MTDSLTAAIAEANAKGMFVNSMWQISKNHWRVSLRNREDLQAGWYFESRDGKTPEGAIRAAMVKMPPAKPKATATDLGDLL